MAKARKRRTRGEGGLFKHPNSKNWYSQILVNGEPSRVSTGTSNKRDAQEFHDIRKEKIRKGEVVVASKLTVTALYEAYLLDSKNNDLQDIRNIESRWRNHLE